MALLSRWPARIASVEIPSEFPGDTGATIGARLFISPRTAELTFMATRAGARITYVNAGHLSLISRSSVVTRVILEAVQASG